MAKKQPFSVISAILFGTEAGVFSKMARNTRFLHFLDPQNARFWCQFSVLPKFVHIQGCSEKRTSDPRIRVRKGVRNGSKNDDFWRFLHQNPWNPAPGQLFGPGPNKRRVPKCDEIGCFRTPKSVKIGCFRTPKSVKIGFSGLKLAKIGVFWPKIG